MDIRFEACSNCKDQCRLERGSELIIKLAQNGTITPKKASEKASVLSQDAGNFECPKPEIRKFRTKIATEIGGSQLRFLTHQFNFVPNTQSESK